MRPISAAVATRLEWAAGDTAHRRTRSHLANGTGDSPSRAISLSLSLARSLSLSYSLSLSLSLSPVPSSSHLPVVFLCLNLLVALPPRVLLCVFVCLPFSLSLLSLFSPTLPLSPSLPFSPSLAMKLLLLVYVSPSPSHPMSQFSVIPTNRMLNYIFANLAIDSGGYVYEQHSRINCSIRLDASKRSRDGV